ncbi:MAG: hypothetical protein HZC14_00880 [Candidatus Niyogibacteria bacterium]|nr:hypothetical protein [Candidatus Niyogibacteria bacterium]
MFKIKSIKSTNAGISMMELVVATAVAVILASLIFSGLTSFRRSQELSRVSSAALLSLEDARAKTMRSEADAQYGVHFESSRVALFKGAAYNASDVNNVYFDFPNSVEMSAASLNGGGADVLFERLTGITAQYGTVIIRLKAYINDTKTITIFNSGISSSN